MQLFLSVNGAVRTVYGHESDTVAAVCGLKQAQGRGGDLRVMQGGRTLDPAATLAEAFVPPCATLQLVPRVRGGGGDGGSTGAESRSSYLEMYRGKRADKVNPDEERLARWTTCQLSGMALQPPCVVDELGSLFNKDAVLQALLSKSMPKPLGHIGSLKHVIELKLEAAPGGEPGAGDGATLGTARFVCPVTGLALNGKSRFVVFRKTGHVLSERALKEVPKVVEELVGGAWKPADLLVVNPAGEELQELREKLLLKRLAKQDRKSKDKAAAKAKANGGEAAAAEGHALANGGSKRGADSAAAADAALEAGGAAAAKKFKAAELKPKGADDKVWNSLFTSSRGDGGSRNDYMVRAATRYVM